MSLLRCQTIRPTLTHPKHTPGRKIITQAKRKPESKENEEATFGLDDLDPVRLGRKSRQAFDDLWTQFATLASPTRSFDSELFYDPVVEIDEAARNTKVLVIGATGRTGRIVLRKLLLRGYQVRMVIRKGSTGDEIIPSRVEVVVGDILDSKFCQRALEGIDKVVFAASGRSFDPAEYHLVFNEGLKNVLHAFMDCKWVKRKNKALSKHMLVNFDKPEVLQAWNCQGIGRSYLHEGDLIPKMSNINGIKQWTEDQNSFIIKIAKNHNLHFKGAANDIGAVAEIGGPVDTNTLQDKEGIVLRLRGDGNVYAVVCTMDDGERFAARFATKWGYTTYRIPFTIFRPERGGNDTLNGSRITKIGIRYENRGKPAAAFEDSIEQPLGRFNLELDWIKTLPTGKETEFVLITCAGVSREGVELETLQEIILAKRLGESMLRNSGIGYTIVRPTSLVDEPGGLKSLIFDQGDRLSESISTVDVADVCVRSLPQPLARNKTFEVAHESRMNGKTDNEAFELIAHVPDKSTNYLGAALANLQKNT